MVVKRFKQMNNVGREEFHEHMRRVGRLKHTNLLPLVAYYYRKEEKLLVHDFVPYGSLAVHLHSKFLIFFSFYLCPILVSYFLFLFRWLLISIFKIVSKYFIIYLDATYICLRC
ncbi:unnamed protein product [Linum tenue]|uniref:Serine-threonine/tyrosine-protein kinase catalytic domain-containing protein n=1 Tax=Linum tenue TaxID=586396 RepID=A0AAV0HPT8_9ROSI|nr:unnamed protein product [Linum tenue]